MKTQCWPTLVALFLAIFWNPTSAAAADVPTVAIVAPSSSRLSEFVTLSAAATNHDPVAGVQFLVNGQPLGAADTIAPYSVRWDTLARTNGAYVLTASVSDIGGNSVTSAPVNVTVANIDLNYFVDEVVVSGLEFVASMEFLPGGRMLMAELGGVIRVVQAGANHADATPFAVLPAVRSGDGGLLDITLDPEFSENHYLYAFYVHVFERERLTRLTVSEDGNGVVEGSEVVLWENDANRSVAHHGATIAFGPDGKLYVSLGEQFTAEEAQSLTSYFGKILRINPDGTIPADNPFHDGAGPNKDEIWAYGLRNPFRMSFDGPTGRLFIGDVGGNENVGSHEEINLGTAGGNYGWPLREGPPNGQPPFGTPPIYSYPHGGRDGSVTGGFVYRGTDFPEEFQGSYFFADYVQNWIKRLTFDPEGNVEAVRPFLPRSGASDDPAVGDIVELKQGPDGALYYLDLSFGISNYEELPNEGALRRIRYVGMRNRPPVARVSANPLSGLAPLTVSFSGEASSDPEGDLLTYSWEFGDGATASGSNVEHVYQQNGRFTAVLTVSDGTDSNFTSVPISVGHPPSGIILSPDDGMLFRAGDDIVVEGTASDTEDGTLPATAFRWDVVFHHESHVHPGETVSGTNRFNFTIPTTGHDYAGSNSYEIFLTVTDSNGLQSTRSVFVFPDKVNLAFDTVPSGLTLKLDGFSKVTPFTNETLIGFEHLIEAPDQVSSNGSGYTYIAWNDGAAQSHVIISPDQDWNYSATFDFRGDGVPPAIVEVTALDAYNVEVLFSESVEGNSAQNPANYQIDNGVSVTWALLGADPRKVTLVTTPLIGGNYNLAINHVTDLANPPNPVASNAQAQFTFTPASPRVTAGLVVLYGFEEGAGTLIHDVSGIGAPLDLGISDPARIQWVGGGTNGVRFVSGGGSIRSPGAAGKIHTALTASDRLTLEAWVTPLNLTQNDPARIVTISEGTASSDVNLHLGQEFGSASYRLRTTDNPFNTMQFADVFTSSINACHVVATYDGSAQLLYVDGLQHPTDQSVSGSLANWNVAYPLVLGNEATLDRSWLGTVHLVALYDRALSLAEIQQNHAAGPRLIDTTAADTTPPAIMLIAARDATTIRVLFSEPVETASAESPDNYTIDNGVSVSAAVVEPDRRTVTLSTSTLLGNALYTLTCSNVTDRAVPANPVLGGPGPRFSLQALVCTPDDLSRGYGSPNPTLTGRIAGIMPNDEIVATYSTAAEPFSPVGSYDIVATLSDPGNRLINYSVTLNKGTLAVTQAGSLNTLTSSRNPTERNSGVTFTSTLTALPPASGTPSGTIEFLTNGAPLGAPVLLDDGVASISTSFEAAGSFLVTARYAGDGNFRPSTNSLEQSITPPVQAPEIVGIRRSADNTLTIALGGMPGSEYVVQATTDLGLSITWTNVATGFVGANGTATFSESLTNGNRRFYRAVSFGNQ
jgi:glucose/arabinose dehydrogenase/PKD repeat protein